MSACNHATEIFCQEGLDNGGRLNLLPLIRIDTRNRQYTLSMEEKLHSHRSFGLVYSVSESRVAVSKLTHESGLLQQQPTQPVTTYQNGDLQVRDGDNGQLQQRNTPLQ
jgi:hypothetical protein